jgi:hypothetical protein
MGFGAVPFGGDLDADEPDTMAPEPVATAAVFGAPTIDSAQSGDSIVSAALQNTAAADDQMMQINEATPESGPALTGAPQNPVGAPAELAVQPAAPATPTRLAGLDHNALAAASQAAIDVQVSAANLDDEIADAGRITVPVPASTPALTAPARRSAQPANRTVVAIDGLEIVGMAGSANDYRLVQTLESGESVAITVVPFVDAPAGQNGQLAVQAGAGDSVIGTRRFYDSFVTIEAAIEQNDMRALLDRLTERNWR